MPLTKPLRVIKVPLPRDERPPDRPQAFPSMPVLYLELLENKAKIKQDLINKTYVPNSNRQVPNFQPVQHKSSSPQLPSREDYRHDKRHENDVINERINTDSVSSPATPEIRDDSDSDVVSRPSSVSVGSDISRDEGQYSQESNPESDEASERSRESRESDDLSLRLKELLQETDDESIASFENFKRRLDDRTPGSPESPEGDKYSRDRGGGEDPFRGRSSHASPPYRSVHREHRDHGGSRHGHGAGHHGREPYDGGRRPPTLKELQEQGHYRQKAVMRDLNQPYVNEQESDDKKRELMFKFDLLKKSYPKAVESIPEFTIHSDLYQMQKSYDSTVRRLSLDSTVENYKTYLIGGFMLTEFVFGNFLGFDMQGFTQQQIISMSTYERLLIELGEKSYVPTGSKWPVELRLLFMIIMNAAFFIVSKMIMRSTGANLMNMINNMNAAPATTQPAASRKRKMRGPQIDLDDIPDVSEDERTHAPQGA